jgi:glyoxylase-like metal-dependent hydrolase (beta-lactamase superfamily II)
MSQLTELYPNLWIVDITLPEYSVRGVVIVGDKQVVVWDTLSHPNDMAGIESIIGDKPYHVVYSHADWDHIWGTAGLTGQPLSIIGQTHCLERFNLDVPKTLTKMQQDQPNQWDDVELIPPTQTFDKQMTLDLGGITLELHHLPGHTQECIVGWLPELGILLGGDVIETPLPVIEDDSPVEDWLNSLKQWADNDKLMRTIPAHGTIEGRVCLDNTINYLQKLLGDSDFPIPDNLDDFYRDTHTKNLKIVRNQ